MMNTPSSPEPSEAHGTCLGEDVSHFLEFFHALPWACNWCFTAILNKVWIPQN